MEKRRLGKTGRELSVVGFGGIIVMDETPEDAVKFVKEAVRRGITYFDVAPTYGNAEERLGPALEPYREDVFLACKTAEREREGAWKELQQSLKTLRTDHFDLYQLHGVVKMSDVDTITGKGGALEAFREAREQGLVRHLGFSAHDEKAAITLMERFDFDTMMFPVNYVTWLEGGFGAKALAAAKERGMGITALKSLGRTKWAEGEKRTWPKCWYKPVLDKSEAALALRWTLSKPVTSAVSPSHADLLWWMCDAAENLTPITADEEKALAARAKGLDPIFRA